LNRAGDARGAEREEPLVHAVCNGFRGVDVLEDVYAVHREQDLMHVERIVRALRRQHLDGPAVSAYRNHAERSEILRAFDAETRLDRAIAFVVFADELCLQRTLRTVRKNRGASVICPKRL
jgi:hypothetical protein